jgi:hypothetical protein
MENNTVIINTPEEHQAYIEQLNSNMEDVKEQGINYMFSQFYIENYMAIDNEEWTMDN